MRRSSSRATAERGTLLRWRKRHLPTRSTSGRTWPGSGSTLPSGRVAISRFRTCLSETPPGTSSRASTTGPKPRTLGKSRRRLRLPLAGSMSAPQTATKSLRLLRSSYPLRTLIRLKALASHHRYVRTRYDGVESARLANGPGCHALADEVEMGRQSHPSRTRDSRGRGCGGAFVGKRVRREASDLRVVQGDAAGGCPGDHGGVLLPIGCEVEIGAGDEIRTRDFNLGKVALYH